MGSAGRLREVHGFACFLDVFLNVFGCFLDGCVDGRLREHPLSMVHGPWPIHGAWSIHGPWSIFNPWSIFSPWWWGGWLAGRVGWVGRLLASSWPMVGSVGQ